MRSTLAFNSRSSRIAFLILWPTLGLPQAQPAVSEGRRPNEMLHVEKKVTQALRPLLNLRFCALGNTSFKWVTHNVPTSPMANEALTYFQKAFPWSFQCWVPPLFLLTQLAVLLSWGASFHSRASGWVSSLGDPIILYLSQGPLYFWMAA